MLAASSKALSIVSPAGSFKPPMRNAAPTPAEHNARQRCDLFGRFPNRPKQFKLST